MFITIYPDQKINHPQLQSEHFNIDVDPSLTIENIKILITLKFVDLAPESFELAEFQSKILIDSKSYLHQILPQDSESQLALYMIPAKRKCCCNLL